MILTEGNLFGLLFFLTKLIFKKFKIRKKSLFLQFQKLKTMSLSEQEIIRREKLQKLTEMGINAFPADEYKITDTTKSIKNDFAEGKK